MAAEGDEDGLPHLAERLNVLFDHVVRPQDGSLYSTERAADDLKSAGISVTSSYLRQLRSGRRRNPTARLLAGIADLFEVPITYFLDDQLAQRITDQLQSLADLRAAGVRGVLARSSDPGQENIPDLTKLLQQIRRHQERGQGPGDEE